MYGYEWTDEYGIFRLTIDAKIQKEIRPVFHEELDFFGMDKYWDYPKDTDAPLLWAEGIRRYVMNGVCVAEAEGGGFFTVPKIKLNTAERIKLEEINIKRLIEVNHALLVNMKQKAVGLIQKQYEKYSKLGYSFICAFSGGKDSLVLLDLVSKALAPSEFLVVFSNTGMELSATLKAVERAKLHWPHLRFVEAKCHMEPTESWDEFGPPGRRMRWCCAVHKSVPTILKLREITGNYNAKAVVFDGVRAEESARRAKYDEVSEGAKNISQVNVSPIHKWNTAELYCYLLHEKILLNDAYKLGLFRVGCMVCPLSSDWWDGIANHYYADEMRPLLNRVEQYAKRTKVETEVVKYIEGGGWKARMGGRGLPNGGNRVEEKIQENTIHFSIKQPTQEWLSCAPVRAGTENVASIVGMSVALQKNVARLSDFQSRLLSLEQVLTDKLNSAAINYRRNGTTPRVPGNLSLSFPYADGEAILHRLDLMGIMVSTGSACDSKNTQISHVLHAINADELYAKGTVRISLGKDNTVNEAEKIADAIIKIVSQKR